MTTIAWQPGVLAADRKAGDGDLALRCTKLYKTAGHAIGFAGVLTEGLKFIEWFPEKSGKCPLRDTEAIVMDLSTGKACLYESDKRPVPIPVEDTCFAIGSGGHLAIGAMEAGATPLQAVKIACKRDNGSGMGTQVVRSK